MKTWIIASVSVVVVAAGIWLFVRNHHDAKPVAYRTTPVERGAVVQIVRATGNVQPVKLVQVGTQVNGPILKLGADFNTAVKVGDVVAQIDPAVYQANLAQANATLEHSRASEDETAARLLQASNDLLRATGLAKRDLLSKADLDTAIANAASAQAEFKMAVAQVQQNTATLQLAQANLGYTTITAPVDGVVVSRNVDAGQTVVASMSAQTLFTIATDLRVVLINACVPEADIGQIHEGQTVTFSVDAYPLTFTGMVDQVRLASSTIQNVVTYPVIVRAINPELKLYPGMTANISCIVANHTNILRVANAAFRFKPEKASTDKNGGSTAIPPASSSASARRMGSKVILWTQAQDGSLRPLNVTLGITDGFFTEISGDGIQEGLDVVTGIDDTAQNAVVNPFMPTPPAANRPRPPRM